MPWHHQQVYLEELVVEFPDVFGWPDEERDDLAQASSMGIRVERV